MMLLCYIIDAINKFGEQCFFRCHPIPTLDYSHRWIPLFFFAEEYIRAEVIRYTSDEYELFTHVQTSKCVVTFVLRYAAAS